MQKVVFQDLGTIDYKSAWDYQEKLHREIVERKLLRRQENVKINAEESEEDAPHLLTFSPAHFLLFCEHPHVYTLGKSGKETHLLLDNDGLKKNEAEYFQINRGGDITYHGPGQIVGYPILDLDYFFTDIHKYLRYLEEAIIRTLKEYGIEAGRIAGLTGVWIEPESKLRARKICAFGVRCSRWVTMHGFAFNVNTELKYFGNIVPCGIIDKQVTSLEKELGRKMNMEEVKEKVKKHLAALFEMELVTYQET